MENWFLSAGFALCAFALWAIAWHDWLRLTRPARRVLARVSGHRSGLDEGERSYAAIFTFSAEGRDWDVIDSVLASAPEPPEGTVRELAYPQGRPDLARRPRPAMWLFVYATLLFMLGILAARLLGWIA